MRKFTLFIKGLSLIIRYYTRRMSVVTLFMAHENEESQRERGLSE